jgi:DNA uptake protein ComE-like DNA-binding protein
MPRSKPSLAERKRLLEETKQRLRLLQEARTIERIEQLNIKASKRLGRQLQAEQLELNSELDSEENLASEQSSSSTVETVNINKSSSLLETPD